MPNDLLVQMEEGMPSYSKGQKQIARYIIERYEKAAYMTASRLGEAVGVSESTVVRFATELGFEGYPEFQRAIREITHNRLTSFQRMEVSDHLIGDGNVLDKILYADAEKIKSTAESIDHAAFDRAVDAIIGAKNIYILGVRSSAALADFLGAGLLRVSDNVRLIRSTSGSEVFEQMIDIGQGDVLIAISFPRYSKRVVTAVEFAGRAGADVVALTDSPRSPLARCADQLLLARSDSAAFVDSLVAPLSIINAILVAISRKKKGELTERLQRLEQIWDEYEVYDKSR